MYFLETSSPNKARNGAMSENKLLLMFSPASAKTTGTCAAKTDAPKNRDGEPNIFSQLGRAGGRQCSAVDTSVLSSEVVGCAMVVGRFTV